MLWSLNFLGGGLFIIFDRYYKIRLAADHHAEFHGAWPTELGDLALEKSF